MQTTARERILQLHHFIPLFQCFGETRDGSVLKTALYCSAIRVLSHKCPRAGGISRMLRAGAGGLLTRGKKASAISHTLSGAQIWASKRTKKRSPRPLSLSLSLPFLLKARPPSEASLPHLNSLWWSIFIMANVDPSSRKGASHLLCN